MSGPPRIIALCAVSAGIDIVRQLEAAGCPLAAAIGLAPKPGGRANVAGWVDLDQARELATPRFCAQTYNLSAAEDRALLERLKPDLVLVVGWQRLIPEWLIGLARYGAWGVHGSPEGIAAGRGRSPQNWALIMGASGFELSLFRITPGIDDGPVLATRRFALTEHDDIATSYAKTVLATSAMIHELVAGDRLDAEGEPQAASASYYPQRLPEDGWVDWHLSAATVARHCRALTRPYPGLRTASGGDEGAMWRIQPFDDASGEAGRVDATFTDGSFVVGCGQGRVLVREASLRPKPGDLLEGRPFRQTMETIIGRHEANHPSLPLADSILALRDSANG